MVKTLILSKVLLLCIRKGRKTWKTSFTFLVVFRISGAPHVTMPYTFGNRTLAERGTHVPYLIYWPYYGIKIRMHEEPRNCLAFS